MRGSQTIIRVTMIIWRFAWLRRSRPLRPVGRTLPIDDPPARPSTFVDLTRETCRERGFTWPGVDMDISLAVRKLGVTKRRMRYVYLKAAAAALRQPGRTNALTLCRAGNIAETLLDQNGPAHSAIIWSARGPSAVKCLLLDEMGLDRPATLRIDPDGGKSRDLDLASAVGAVPKSTARGKAIHQ